MRVLIVNTSEKDGGAAVASNRLMDALNNNGVKAKMLVRDKVTDDITVVGLGHPMRQRWHFLWERWCIFWRLHFQREHLFDLDIANIGTDITRLPEFKEADIIHLAWVNQGMLSLSGIQKILKSGKPIVWTMHDIWPATGICHTALGCNTFKTGCRDCKYLPGGGSTNDLSTKLFARKRKLYQHSGIHFVTCSKWLGDQARQSALLTGMNIFTIPNPIDTHIYKKGDQRQARLHAGLPAEGNIILFVSQRVTLERKGMNYFIKGLEKLLEQHPEMKDNTSIAILGGHSEELAPMLPLRSYSLGYINDDRKIVDVYNSANVYVLPSLDDNLPNTIMEAMACGVPCVGFKVGGIPEMIDHEKNGYVARFKDTADLAEGIHWVLREADHEALSQAAVAKVTASYSQRAVAMQYIEVYNQAMAFKNYRIG